MDKPNTSSASVGEALKHTSLASIPVLILFLCAIS